MTPECVYECGKPSQKYRKFYIDFLEQVNLCHQV